MKSWLPFFLTLIISLAVCGGWYWWQWRELSDLRTQEALPAVRSVPDNAPGGVKKPVVSAAGEGPEMKQLKELGRPTRNGLRNLFERSRHILTMSREDVEKLLAEMDAGARTLRSPMHAIAFLSAYARLAELDPAGALARAAKLKGEKREMATFAALNEWITRDRKAAVAWFVQQPDDESKKRFLAIAAFTMSGDPSIVGELSGSVSDPKMRAEALRESIRALAFANPEEALKRLEEIEDEDQRLDAERDIFHGLMFRHPEKAVTLAFSHPPGDRLRDEAPQAVGQWARQNPADALKWLTGQPKDVQSELFGQREFGAHFAKATPAELESAALRVHDLRQRNQLYAGYAVGRAAENAADGFADISRVRDRDMQREALNHIARAAATQNRASAMEGWLETSPPAELRDSAVAEYARAIGQRDRTAGQEWAARITDSRTREQVLAALAAQRAATPPPAVAPRLQSR